MKHVRPHHGALQQLRAHRLHQRAVPKVSWRPTLREVVLGLVGFVFCNWVTKVAVVATAAAARCRVQKAAAAARCQVQKVAAAARCLVQKAAVAVSQG